MLLRAVDTLACWPGQRAGWLRAEGVVPGMRLCMPAPPLLPPACCRAARLAALRMPLLLQGGPWVHRRAALRAAASRTTERVPPFHFLMSRLCLGTLRVGANSPSLWPTIGSLTSMRVMRAVPLCTKKTHLRKSGRMTDARL